MSFRFNLLQRAVAAVSDVAFKSGNHTSVGAAYEAARHLCTWKSDRCLNYIIANPPGLYWHQPTKQVVEVVDYIEEHVKGHCAYLLVEVAELGRVRAERSDIKKLTEQQLATATLGDILEF